VTIRTLNRILIANRGEIALRVVRTVRDLGGASILPYTPEDLMSPAAELADEAHALPEGSSYTDADAILSMARATGADAVHPGYGFLSENDTFAQAGADAGRLRRVHASRTERDSNPVSAAPTRGSLLLGPALSACARAGLRAAVSAISAVPTATAAVPAVSARRGLEHRVGIPERSSHRTGLLLSCQTTAGGQPAPGNDIVPALGCTTPCAMARFEGGDTGHHDRWLRP